MTEQELDREWTQDELKQYLIINGWNREDLENEVFPIPQGVKYIDFSHTITEEVIRWGKEVVKNLGFDLK